MLAEAVGQMAQPVHDTAVQVPDGREYLRARHDLTWLDWF
jgi:hypothetical protein